MRPFSLSEIQMPSVGEKSGLADGKGMGEPVASGEGPGLSDRYRLGHMEDATLHPDT